MLLLFLCAVAGHYHRKLIPVSFFCCFQHFHKRLINTFVNFFAAGNFDKAAAVLGDLFHMQEKPVALLAALGRHLRQLYTARRHQLRENRRAEVISLSAG